MPAQPVALAELGAGPSMLVPTNLSRRKLRRDLLVLVEEALEPAWREKLHSPHGFGARVAQGVGHPSRL